MEIYYPTTYSGAVEGSIGLSSEGFCVTMYSYLSNKYFYLPQRTQQRYAIYLLLCICRDIIALG